MSLLEFIPRGRENAVTAKFLMQMTGLSDRALRKEIQDINESGTVMICREHKKGYYIPATEREAESYIRYSQSYLITLARKDRAMRTAKDKMFSNQMELDIQELENGRI